MGSKKRPAHDGAALAPDDADMVQDAGKASARPRHAAESERDSVESKAADLAPPVSHDGSPEKLDRAFVSHDKPRRRHGRAYVVAAVLVAGAIGVGVVVLSAGKTEEPRRVSRGCSTELLKRANKVLPATRVVQLSQVAEEIRRIPTHTQDVNCNYVVLMYAVNMSDAKLAREYYGHLEQTYTQRKGYHAAIADSAFPPRRMRPVVIFLEQQAKATQQNGAGTRP